MSILKWLGSRTHVTLAKTETVKGYGAAKPRGGDRRSEKVKNQSVSTYELNGTNRSKGGASPVGLAARLAESTDPKIRKEITLRVACHPDLTITTDRQLFEECERALRRRTRRRKERPRTSGIKRKSRSN